MASARPPRNGPIWRHCIPLKSFSSIAAADAGKGEAVGAGLRGKCNRSEKKVDRQEDADGRRNHPHKVRRLRR